MKSIFAKLKLRKTHSKTICIEKHNNVLMIAHRGLSGILRENTLPAFALAGKHSYFGIETDVHATADGKFVIIHDERTNRVSRYDIDVEKSDFKEVHSIILDDLATGKPDKSLYIPTLDEYIKVCKKHKKVCILEIKNAFTEEQIKEVIDIIESKGYLEQVIFISFVLSNLITLRKLLPNQPLQYLTDKFNEEVLNDLTEYKLDLDIIYTALNRDLVEFLHEKHISVNCWTVNDKRDAEDLAKWGVDYITTNILE